MEPGGNLGTVQLLHRSRYGGNGGMLGSDVVDDSCVLCSGMGAGARQAEQVPMATCEVNSWVGCIAGDEVFTGYIADVRMVRSLRMC